MPIYPHLAWFIVDGYPTLWRRDTGKGRAYNTCAEACKAAGIALEDFIRQR